MEQRVAALRMDAHEVTNAEFAAFVAATGYVTTAERDLPADSYPGLPAEFRVPGAMVFTEPKAVLDDLDPSRWWTFTPGANWRHPDGPGSSITSRGSEPVTQVSYADAKAYAAWRGHDLPTEAEWEWAARGGQNVSTDDWRGDATPPPSNRWEGVFPYSDSAQDGFHGLAPVGCYVANGYGLFDMIGNVWEWTSDIYRAGHTAAGTAEEPDPKAHAPRVIKGGSWLCSPVFCGRYRPTARQPGEADLGSSHIGFRTVWRGQ